MSDARKMLEEQMDLVVKASKDAPVAMLPELTYAMLAIYESLGEMQASSQGVGPGCYDERSDFHETR